MTTVARSDDVECFESSIRSHEISPELVLVDPELAAVARTSLALQAEKAPLAAVPPSPAPPELRAAAVPRYFPLEVPQFVHSAAAPADEPPRGWEAVAAAASHLFTLVTPALLFLSFLVNLALAGALFAGGGDAPHLESSSALVERISRQSPEPAGETPAVVQTSTQPSSRKTGRARAQSKGTAKVRAARARAQARAQAKASAERTVLTLLQTTPKGRIAALIDPRSGLLRNNVQAVCRRLPARHVASFVCAIRVAGAPRRSSVYVRYSVKPGGGWSVTWLRRPKG
jgi:hypothetical protein